MSSIKQSCTKNVFGAADTVNNQPPVGSLVINTNDIMVNMNTINRLLTFYNRPSCHSRPSHNASSMLSLDVPTISPSRPREHYCPISCDVMIDPADVVPSHQSPSPTVSHPLEDLLSMNVQHYEPSFCDHPLC